MTQRSSKPRWAAAGSLTVGLALVVSPALASPSAAPPGASSALRQAQGTSAAHAQGTTAAASVTAAASAAKGSELSVSTRLADRREVAAGTRAYSLGFEDGGFYANGWHITGEMGGIWTPPVKLLDGVWFGLDGQWVGPAKKFTSGWGYTRYDLPTTAGLGVSRTDVAPDGRRGVLFGLTLRNPGKARTTKLSVDAHSELMGQYPWGFDGITPNASDNLPDKGSYDGKRLVFTDDGALPGAPTHHYAAMVGTALTPSTGAIGASYYGPRPGTRCTGQETGAPSDPKPSACDDGPFGKGTGGRLTYEVKLPAHGSRTIWLGVAGSDQGSAQARSELTKLLENPAKELRTKIKSRQAVAAKTQLQLPGDPKLAEAVDWGKQNMADLTLQARDLHIRWTNQGKQFPASLGTIDKANWIGAGYPDYPWIFGTDAEYTSFAAVSVGQFDAIKGHLNTLRKVSDLLNNRSGVVTHEVVSDGSVYFGHDSRATNPDGTTSYDFNTDETVKFPSAVALIWRWTGDVKFLNANYDFTKRNLHYVASKLDADGDGWPEGLGNVERNGMGPEKLDNTVYFIRGLYDLADMAKAEGDTATYRWATKLGTDLRNRFDKTWWYAAAAQYADSLGTDNAQSFQKHWIGQTPMDAELVVNGQTVPGLAPQGHGTTALGGRQNDCFSGSRPLNRGLFHTGCGGGPDGKGELVVYGLTTSIQSIGEGNYGRLASNQQGRYTNALAETMFGEPATGGTPDEQPGAMPEIFPSPDQGANIDRCWTCRSMFMQAWGNYGTAWAVVHQWLGVRPDLGRNRLSIVPEVPQDQKRVAGENIRLGDGSVDVAARHTGTSYTTEVTTHRLGGVRLEVGQTLPRNASIRSVRIDGHRAASYLVRTTNRGLEVTVPAGAGHHSLVITTR